MKTIQYWNTFAIGLPIMFLCLSIFNVEAIAMAVASLMLTGLIQVIIGLSMLFNNPENKQLRIYAGSVGLFFTMWIINAGLGYFAILTYILFPIPIVLAIYLSVIVYNTKN
ncbi:MULTISPECIES: hypothetical protein [Flavobacterium]|uniref:Acid-resistance membrane protein n=1 Tax=Flavobacterium jumunjinense TaxID=998845 RepID=A0ABV5GU10_9FLAO|nr:MULTISPECIES: hypothetical protein [Flavobacterium]